jgi:hypothetical protein
VFRRHRALNETLRRAIFHARLDEEDVAARLGVDPKTVRRWIEGRLPYPRHRWALAYLLRADEADLWPEVRVARASRSRPEELRALYAHRWAVPRDVWRNLFAAAQCEISILVYSGLFLAEDAAVHRILVAKAKSGVRVRIAVGEPDSPSVNERGAQEGIDEGMAAKIRNALVYYRPLKDVDGIEVRLHRTNLYNSIYRADDTLLINQHAYGVPAAHGPVAHVFRRSDNGMASAYLESFERVWSTARALT